MTRVVVPRGVEISIDEDCTERDNTRQGMLLSKCPHTWTTVCKRSTKIAQSVSDISNLGTEVGRTSFVVLDMFSSVVSFSKTVGWSP